VAFSTKRNQISLAIVTEYAAPPQVVNVEILEAAALLTAPVITRQDFFAQRRVSDGGHSYSGSLFRE
jgi:hypothetical protein